MPFDLSSVEDRLRSALRALENSTRQAEVLAQSTGGHVLRYSRQATTPRPAPIVRGAVFRAWGDGQWFESASSSFEPARLQTCVEALRRHLAVHPAASDPPGEPPKGDRTSETRPRRSLDSFPLESRLELAKEYFSWVTSVEGVRDAEISIQHAVDERLLLGSSGARRHQRILRVRASIGAIAVENGKAEFDFATEGGTGGPELFDPLTQEVAVQVAREAKALLHAPGPPTGPMMVLLDPESTGTFAHESFGHGTEADQILRQRSYLAPLLGQSLGPESLTIVDDGSYPAGWGTLFFDDEGHDGQRTLLVDHGRFVGVLDDRETAAAMKRSPTGNTRRADFTGRMYVRMTNTYAESGDWSFEELVKEAKRGVLLEHCVSGIEDPLGGQMQLKMKKGHRIKRGELGELVTSMALSGRVLDFLLQIRGIGRRESFEMKTGYCGKGHSDSLPTGTGGSYLLSKASVGPG